MVNASFINRLSHAVDLIENRIQQNRGWKVVTVRRGLHEDGNAARDRHFAAHPEDREGLMRARIVPRRLGRCASNFEDREPRHFWGPATP